MSMPFWVPTEQAMKDKADYARKGIARGRAVAALVYEEGVLICAENPSDTLRKVAEIYDRIAFAGVGKYNEYDQLRIAGVRLADMKGYAYSREDVDARTLANAFAQTLGQIFTHELKPMEVEILVAGVSPSPGDDQMFHILYDGTVMDEDQFAALGGEAEAVADRLEAGWQEGLNFADALHLAVGALSGPDRVIGAGDLEVAKLIRTDERRAFRRIEGPELEALVPSVSDGDVHGGPKADIGPPLEDNDSDSGA